MVKKCRKGDGKSGKPWCLYTKDGSRLLGAHKSKEDAYKQEAAIKAHGMVQAGNVIKFPGKYTKPSPKNVDKNVVKRHMQKVARDHVDRHTGEVNFTKLAEETAIEFDRTDWLDDETHWVWDLAVDVGEAFMKAHGAVAGLMRIVAALDVVAEELEEREEGDLAEDVDLTAGGLADFLDQEIEKELNRAGFTSTVMKRAGDVAEKIYKERIPNIDLVTYYDNP